MSVENKEFLSFDFEVKGNDPDKGVIEGYGSVFGNVDFHNDVVDSGAFRKSLQKRMPALLLHHDMRSVAGIWTSADEDDKGLRLTGQLNMEVQKAREAFYLAKQGALKGLSIGFITRKDRIENGVRHIMEADLLEVSMVTFPANERANLTGTKSVPSTERELEKALRDMGYGQTQAKAIVASGFKGFLAMQRDVDGLEKVRREADSILENLKQLKETLKGK
jgi:HK97 family phage prohead protease